MAGAFDRESGRAVLLSLHGGPFVLDFVIPICFSSGGCFLSGCVEVIRSHDLSHTHRGYQGASLGRCESPVRDSQRRSP